MYKTLLLTTLLFIGCELALQLRAELKYGNSLFSRFRIDAVKVEPMYQQRDGYQTLSPGVIIDGLQMKVRANSLGLRSDELSLQQHGKTVLVLGASTVFGAVAPDNQQTFPALLQQLMVDIPLRVINAGIPGNSINQQYHLYQQLLDDVPVDVLILYSGLANDISGLCRRPAVAEDFTLPQVSLPSWLLFVDLLLKNTTTIRYIPYHARPVHGVHEAITRFSEQAEQLLQLALQRGVSRVLVVENVRAFRPEQDVAEQRKLANTALYYSSCMNVAQYSMVFDAFNDALHRATAINPVGQYIRMQHRFPGGRQYFADSVHFTAKGEALMAEILAEELRQLPELQQ